MLLRWSRPIHNHRNPKNLTQELEDPGISLVPRGAVEPDPIPVSNAPALEPAYSQPKKSHKAHPPERSPWYNQHTISGDDSMTDSNL
jgi:hypothetical protein